MTIAIIPARGGSERIPDKNTRDFLGKPMIAYSIEAARESGVFDRILVSTDSERIARVANDYGAETPFVRPAELGLASVPLAAVLENTFQWLKDNAIPATHSCCIMATAPFLRPAYIREGFDRIRETNVSSVVSVTAYDYPIFRAFKMAEGGNLEMLWPEHEFTRSNDLFETFHDAAQFYWLNIESFMANNSIFSKDALPVVLPRYLVEDIDEPDDWKRAEIMYQVIQRMQI
jgi:pseudaminic acid cytidylyltransferase